MTSQAASMDDGAASLSFGPGEGAGAIAIVAATAFNGLAPTAHETWAFRRAEATAFISSPFRCDNGERAAMGRIRTLPFGLFGAARLMALVEPLLAPLTTYLGRLPSQTRVGLGVALPRRFGRAGDEAQRAGGRRVVAALEAAVSLPGLRVDTLVEERDHAGFAHVLLSVAQALERRQLDVALVGGLDTHYEPAVIQQLIDERRLFDGEALDTMIPGEGGAFALLVRREDAHQLRWPVAGELRAVSVGREPGSPDDDGPMLGQGASATALRCVQWLERRGLPLGWWLSDMTGEAFRVHELQLCWPRVAGAVSMPADVALDFVPSHLGDLGAATLPTALAIALEGMNRRAPAAQHALCTAASYHGERGGLLVEAGLPQGRRA